MRDICEQLVGKASARMGECDAIYEKKLREGRELEAIRNGQRKEAAPAVELPLTPEQQERSACADGVEIAKKEFAGRMARREFKQAADGMRACASLLEDLFLQNLVNVADAKAKRAKR